MNNRENTVWYQSNITLENTIRLLKEICPYPIVEDKDPITNSHLPYLNVSEINGNLKVSYWMKK